jgi:hypothetical protein
MLKITPQSLLQFDPLQDFSPLDEDTAPTTWSRNWISRRLVEGFKTLRASRSASLRAAAARSAAARIELR